MRRCQDVVTTGRSRGHPRHCSLQPKNRLTRRVAVMLELITAGIEPLRHGPGPHPARTPEVNGGKVSLPPFDASRYP